MGELGNNKNFIYTINNEKFVIRVEDRGDLQREQLVQSSSIAKYFSEDYASFPMAFKEHASSDELVFRPVFISQFAEQSDLKHHIKKQTKNTRKESIPFILKGYFTQLADFVKKCNEAGVYHPDIKPENFLVHKNRIIISDRKTLMIDYSANETFKASDIRSSPLFAAPEYNNTLYVFAGQFFQKPNANQVDIHMPSFMSYQIGMTLKVSLLKSHQIKGHPDDFTEESYSPIVYLDKPSNQIINLSLLSQLLTRHQVQERLKIEHFQQLLNHINKPFHEFVQRVNTLYQGRLHDEVIEEINTYLVKENLGLDEAINLLNKHNDLYGQDLYISALLQNVAVNSFKSSGKPFIKSISNTVENSIQNCSWTAAPWYRKMFYYLSFGFFEVETVEIEQANAEIKKNISEENINQTSTLLNYLPNYLLRHVVGRKQTINLNKWIETQYKEQENASSPFDDAPGKSPNCDNNSKPTGPQVENTVQIHEDSPEPTGTVQIHEDSPEPTGTVQIHEDSPEPKFMQDKLPKQNTLLTSKFGTWRRTIARGNTNNDNVTKTRVEELRAQP